MVEFTIKEFLGIIFFVWGFGAGVGIFVCIVVFLLFLWMLTR